MAARGADHGSNFGLARAREVFWVQQDGDTWLFCSPSIRADMSAALVDTEENWNTLPGNSLRVTPPADADSTVPAISSTGLVKCRSCMRMTDSRVCLTRFRIRSYSISSYVSRLACACAPTLWR
jgi:hypothetical protein